MVDARTEGSTGSRIDLEVEVADAIAFDEPAAVALTVDLPEADLLTDRPVVAFALPGAGHTRRYFTEDLPGPARGAQADWHRERGWVFVSVDHLGAGDSSTFPGDPRLDKETLAVAADAAERVVLERLGAGELVSGFPPVRDPFVVGVGQSMGGAITVVQQANHGTFDAIAVLGFSALGVRRPEPPEQVPATNLARTRWVYYFDDVDASFFLPLPRYGDAVPPWVSPTMPAGVIGGVSKPGFIAAEAAAVAVPVLVAAGERDVVPDPSVEPAAYPQAPSVEVFVCPRMGHMHNHAGTREVLWERLGAWGNRVAAQAAPPGSRTK